MRAEASSIDKLKLSFKLAADVLWSKSGDQLESSRLRWSDMVDCDQQLY